MRTHVACAVVLMIGAVVSAPAAAARTFRLIQGRVSDTRGAVLPGAGVRVSHEQTGLEARREPGSALRPPAASTAGMYCQSPY